MVSRRVMFYDAPIQMQLRPHRQALCYEPCRLYGSGGVRHQAQILGLSALAGSAAIPLPTAQGNV
jgi:hypothetical protein